MKLFYFTHSFPAGKAVNWKVFELEVFSKHVDKIIVIPFLKDYDKDENVRLPASIEVSPPLLDQFKPVRLRQMFVKILLSKYRTFFIAEFLKFRVFTNKSRFLDWLVDSNQICCALNSPVLHSLMKENSEDTVWYFYWGRNPALIIPFLKKTISARIVCRFHGYDLYKDRNNGYIPFQEKIVSNCDLALPCSTDGYNYLQKNFHLPPDSLFVARLGTRFRGLAKIKTGRRLNIVSCSFCVPVKRLHLIFEAVQRLGIPFCWTHIGDGPLFKEYQKRAATIKNPDSEIQFIGYLPSEAVIPFYLKETFDVFINVSESEGVPVSIMEALSVGLPIIATDVGGTSEIVNDEVGYLLDASISGDQLAQVLRRFSTLPKDKLEAYRESATIRFQSLCDADSNALKLYERMANLFQHSLL